MRTVFTSESVSEGHPDKVCDQISDAILDAYLQQDSESRVACECLATTNFLVISGEITSRAKVDCVEIARKVIAEIGYDSPDVGFCADKVEIQVRLHQQSPDIAGGVDAHTSLSGEQGAGDQGMMFGFACNETPDFMPAPIYYSHKIMERLAELRHSDPKTYWYLRPDAKSQLSVVYEDNHPVAVNNVVVSHQHTADMNRDDLVALVRKVVAEVLPAEFIANLKDEDYFINPTGNFVIGGPHGDTGLTGRKIIVDTYGGMGRHGGGAFSGKDPSKVDRSASYMARYVAKNIVAAGLAERCEIQVAYAIGIAKPLSLYVNFFGTGKVAEADVEQLLAKGEIFDFRPASIIETLGLKRPTSWKYQKAAAYGHFGREVFPWERLDKVEALKQAFKL